MYCAAPWDAKGRFSSRQSSEDKPVPLAVTTTRGARPIAIAMAMLISDFRAQYLFYLRLHLVHFNAHVFQKLL